MANLVRWDPFSDLVSLRDVANRLFEESYMRPRDGWLASGSADALAVDVYETDDAVVVKSAIPGVKPEDIDVSITNDILSIKGETKIEKEIKEENYIRRERQYGSFHRSLAIPKPVVANKAEAEFENGVLTLTLPKAEEIKPKAITVKAKGKK